MDAGESDATDPTARRTRAWLRRAASHLLAARVVLLVRGLTTIVANEVASTRHVRDG